jgi:hypothetical protein
LQPIDSKREEFRKYLERAGVMDALTKVLVSLYEEAEKPDDALEYPFRPHNLIRVPWYNCLGVYIIGYLV